VALSPVTDLALTGDTWSSRAEVDPYFTRSQAAELVTAYVGAHDPKDPLLSPLYGYLASLPPIRVHVGNDEVLLDDTLRYVQRAVDSGVDATADVWECMTHGFLSGAGTLDAANNALEAIGSFLAIRLAVSK
jgi:acetyl esterase/lipase